ncbi:MAG TPA: hypothetical protein VFX87_01360 [Methylomirabilota bacterium]|nr:hypothetical protein [Methylomirabilota bacterium]
MNLWDGIIRATPHPQELRGLRDRVGRGAHGEPGKLFRRSVGFSEPLDGGSRLVSFLKQFGHFFAMILSVAAGLAFFAEWSEPGQGMAKVGVDDRGRTGPKPGRPLPEGVHVAYPRGMAEF